MCQRFIGRKHDPFAIDLIHLFFGGQPALVDADGFTQQSLRRFPHQTRRPAIGAAHDRAACRVRVCHR